LRILITNTSISTHSGSELYVRDVALELLARGHSPIVYSPQLGPLAQAIRRATIAVIDDLSVLAQPPDIIHGQHHLETITALLQFPAAPCVYFCHGWLPWEETAPRHPRILRYVAVSDLIYEHLCYERGIQPDQITTIRNFVDLRRFRPRGPLPPKPRRLLIFSNQANEQNLLGLVRQACEPHDIQVDIRGIGSGNPTLEPEAILGDYDLVLARGRAAAEAIAVGAAVICCDVEGLAGMVTQTNIDRLYRNNFGLRVLDRPITAAALSEEIARYDPHESAIVSEFIRINAGLVNAADKIVEVYNDVLEASAGSAPVAIQEESEAVVRYLSWVSSSIPYKGIYEIQALHERIAQITGERDTLQAQLQSITERIQPSVGERSGHVLFMSMHKGLRAIYHFLIPLPLRLRPVSYTHLTLPTKA
jgi:glycosyltransferase involved in cell wall biosynthesis